MAGIIELLQRRGLQQIANIKIVRHRDKRYDLEALIARGHFEPYYQAYQPRHVFNCDYIVSCIGLPDFKARFFRVYRVRGQRPGAEVSLAPHLAHMYGSDWLTTPGLIWYDLEKLEGFEDLENRVVIDWGPGARSWVQWATVKRDKRIIEGPASPMRIANPPNPAQRV